MSAPQGPTTTSIIRITKKDIDKTKPMDDGWHLFTIEKFSAEPAKDKGSTNWVFDLVCTDPDGDNIGRYGYGRFNSKAPGMLISSGFLPGALDTTVDEEMEFDPNALCGKQLFGLVKTETYEGKLQKRTEQFCSAARPPF